ncbi:MAG: hypothetical protein ACR2FY_25380 [Pirellulaceae bacterium]
MTMFHSSGLEGGGNSKLTRRKVQVPEAADLARNAARHFDQMLGQWISEEPIVFASGDQNLRRYVGGAKENP